MCSQHTRVERHHHHRHGAMRTNWIAGGSLTHMHPLSISPHKLRRNNGARKAQLPSFASVHVSLGSPSHIRSFAFKTQFYICPVKYPTPVHDISDATEEDHDIQRPYSPTFKYHHDWISDLCCRSRRSPHAHVSHVARDLMARICNPILIAIQSFQHNSHPRSNITQSSLVDSYGCTCTCK